jgi:hypothetical protein
MSRITDPVRHVHGSRRALLKSQPATDYEHMQTGGRLGGTPEGGLSEISWYIGRSLAETGGKNDLSTPENSRTLMVEGKF